MQVIFLILHYYFMTTILQMCENELLIGGLHSGCFSSLNNEIYGETSLLINLCI